MSHYNNLKGFYAINRQKAASIVNEGKKWMSIVTMVTHTYTYFKANRGKFYEPALAKSSPLQPSTTSEEGSG